MRNQQIRVRLAQRKTPALEDSKAEACTPDVLHNTSIQVYPLIFLLKVSGARFEKAGASRAAGPLTTCPQPLKSLSDLASVGPEDQVQGLGSLAGLPAQPRADAIGGGNPT